MTDRHLKNVIVSFSTCAVMLTETLAGADFYEARIVQARSRGDGSAPWRWCVIDVVVQRSMRCQHSKHLTADSNTDERKTRVDRRESLSILQKYA